jgi:hypothetical protein
MADNTTLPGTGDVYAADDRGGVKYQKVQLESLTAHSPLVDAFGRLRVSEPTTIFDSKLLGADSAPLFWDEQLESGTMATTTPTANKPYIDFTSTNTTAGLRTRQTFRRFNYQPGKSQLILMTGVLELASGVKTGCERRIGLFDDDNGAFFESDAGTIGITTRTKDSGSAVDTTVAQTSWNLDTLDGGDDAANPSGFTLNVTKAQIFVIDFQWLSVGRVRFGFEIEGSIVYVHEVEVANTLTIPWSSTPNLPLRYQIVTTTDSGVCSMRVICCTVISEGGTDDIGIVRYHSTAGVGVVTNAENSIFAVVGVRLKATHVGATIKFLKAAMQVHTASELLEWLLVFNPTVAGTFTYSDLANSAVQTAVGATANTLTGGVIVDGGYIETGGGGSGQGSGGGELASALALGVAIDGTTLRTVVLAVRPIGGVSAATVEGSLTWREIF